MKMCVLKERVYVGHCSHAQEVSGAKLASANCIHLRACVTQTHMNHFGETGPTRQSVMREFPAEAWPPELLANALTVKSLRPVSQPS